MSNQGVLLENSIFAKEEGTKVSKEEMNQDQGDVRKARVLEWWAFYMEDKKEMMLHPMDASPSIYGARAVFFWIDAILYTIILISLAPKAIVKGALGTCLYLVLMYVIPLVTRIYLMKTCQNKANEIFDEKKRKYLEIRNKYIAEFLTSIGYERNGGELEDCTDEMWTNAKGRIVKTISNEFISCNMREYMNFEYIVVALLSDIELNDKSRKRSEKHARIARLSKYNGKNVDKVSIGVREFDEIFDVYTVDEVKARTYLSSVIVDRLMKNRDRVERIFERGFEVRDDNISFQMPIATRLNPGASFRGQDIKQFVKNAEDFTAGLTELNRELDNYTFLVKGE